MNSDFDSLYASAQRHAQAGRFDDCVRQLQDIVAIAPDHGPALEGLGIMAAQRNDMASAADYLLRAARCMDMSVQQLLRAAQVCLSAGRADDARRLFEQALDEQPTLAPALYGAAVAHAELGQEHAARQKLAQLARCHPKSAEAHYNRGTLLGMLARYEEEIAAYRQAIALKPGMIDAHVNLGVALRDLHRFDEALRQFKQALALDPDHVGARTNRAQTNLLLGQFEHGWREYEWRWRDGMQKHGFDPATCWNGTQDLAGKTLFVHHEQGYGDTMQFVRLAGRLQARGARVVLRVQDALLPLLRPYPGVDAVIGERDPVPAFDYHIPLLSLPHALKLREADFGATPYLAADPARAAYWQAELPADGRPRVGLVWASSRAHRLSHARRSLRLEDMRELLALPAAFVSLQKDVYDVDRELLADLAARGALFDAAPRLSDFGETAALVSGFDLVVTVDTAVAHVSAAMGKPTWILLSHLPDWRWQLAREDTPWYGCVRLFRQPSRDDWATPLGRLREALQRRIDAAGAANS